MSGKQVQRRRGTTQEILTYVGAGKSGEFIYNTETKRIHAMDGITAGGHPQATITDLEAVRQLLLSTISNINEIKEVQLPKKLEEEYFETVDGLELKQILPELKGNKDSLDGLQDSITALVEQISTLQGAGFVTLAQIEADFKDASKWFLKEFVKPVETIGTDGEIQTTYVPLESFSDFKNLVERACAGGAAVDQIVADMADLVEIVATLQATKLNTTDYVVVDPAKVNEWAEDGLLGLVRSSEVYTKEQVEQLVASAIAQAQLASEDGIDEGTLTGALSVYLSKSEAATTYARLDELVNYASKAFVQEAVTALNVPSDVLGKSVADQFYQLKGDFLTEPDLNPYAKTTEVEALFVKKNEAFTRDEANEMYQFKGDYATRNELNHLASASEVELLYAKKNDVYTKQETDSKYQPMGMYLTTDHLSQFVTVTRLEGLNLVDLELMTNFLSGYRANDVKITEIDLDPNIINKINAALASAEGEVVTVPYDDTELRALVTALQTGKADKETVTNAIAQLANKAETSAVTLVADDVAELREEFVAFKETVLNTPSPTEGIQEQIDELEQTKAERSDVEAVSTAIAGINTTKADKTEVTNLQANIDGLKQSFATKEQFASLEGSVNNLSTSKADRTAVESLENSKADKTELATVSGKVSVLESDKASKSELNTVKQELTAGLESKATQTQVNQLSLDVTGLRTEISNLELSSDTTQLAERVDTLETANGELTGTVMGLNMSMASKASQSDVDALSTSVDTLTTEVAGKADFEDLVTLDGRVDTIDVDLAKKADKTELASLTTKTYTDTELAKKADKTELASLATKTYTDTELAKKADASALTTINSKITTLETNVDKKADKTETAINVFKTAANDTYVTSIDTGLKFLLDKIAALEAEIAEIKANGGDATLPEKELEDLRNAIIVPQKETLIAKYSIKNDTITFSDQISFAERSDSETQTLIKGLIKEVTAQADEGEDGGYPQTVTLTHELHLIGADNAATPGDYDSYPAANGVTKIKAWDANDTDGWKEAPYLAAERDVNINRYLWAIEVENWEDPDIVNLHVGYITYENIQGTYQTGGTKRSYSFHVVKVEPHETVLNYKFIV